MFHSYRPMLPFLCDDVHSIRKASMLSFIKPEIVSGAYTILKLCQIDCSSSIKIDLGEY